MDKLSVAECIKFGWETFKKRPLFIIGGFLLAMVMSGIIQALLSPQEDAAVSGVSVLLSVLSAAVGILVEMGLVTFSLRVHDNVESAKIQDLWNPKPFLWYLIAQILVGLSVIIGLVLLIVPGVIIALAFMFSSYLIVDKGRGPIEAIKESWRVTKGHKWELFLLVLAIIGLNILGLIALVVGLLVTIPVSMIAIVHAYRILEGREIRDAGGAAMTA